MTEALYSRELSSDLCNGFLEFRTLFNNNTDVLAYSGIVFSVRNKNDLVEISSMALDVRNDLIVNAENYQVKIYTYPGNFELVMDQPQNWTMVADTLLVPATNPETGESLGYIVPATEFQRTAMNPNTRHSFYITMNGPWIDNTADALDPSGDTAFSNANFDVLTGFGFKLPDFPSEGVATTTSPKFAGTIYYNIETPDCPNQLTTTTVNFLFMFDWPLTNDINAAVGQGIGNVLNNQLDVDNDVLKQYRSSYGLEQEGSPTVYLSVSQASEYPSEWTTCPSLVGSATLKHAAGLQSGDLLYELFTLTDLITAKIKTLLEGKSEILYVGHVDVAADFNIVLQNVPTGASMNDIQLRYFESTTQIYLDKTLDHQIATILGVHVDSQLGGGRRRSLLRETDRKLQTGDITLKGRILGSQSAHFQGHDFITSLEGALDTSQADYLSAMETGLVPPGPINAGSDYKFFSGITAIASTLTLGKSPNRGDVPPEDLSPTMSPTPWVDSEKSDGGKRILSSDTFKNIDPMIWVYIGVGVGVLLLITLVVFIVFCVRKRKRTQDKNPRRKDMERAPKTALPCRSCADAPPVVFVVHPNRQPPPRHRSFDNGPREHPTERGLTRARSFDDSADYARHSQPMPQQVRGGRRPHPAQQSNGPRAPPPSGPAYNGDARSLSRSISFDASPHGALMRPGVTSPRDRRVQRARSFDGERQFPYQDRRSRDCARSMPPDYSVRPMPPSRSDGRERVLYGSNQYPQPGAPPVSSPSRIAEQLSPVSTPNYRGDPEWLGRSGDPSQRAPPSHSRSFDEGSCEPPRPPPRSRSFDTKYEVEEVPLSPPKNQLYVDQPIRAPPRRTASDESSGSDDSDSGMDYLRQAVPQFLRGSLQSNRSFTSASC